MQLVMLLATLANLVAAAFTIRRYRRHRVEAESVVLELDAEVERLRKMPDSQDTMDAMAKVVQAMVIQMVGGDTAVFTQIEGDLRFMHDALYGKDHPPDCPICPDLDRMSAVIGRLRTVVIEMDGSAIRVYGKPPEDGNAH